MISRYQLYDIYETRYHIAGGARGSKLLGHSTPTAPPPRLPSPPTRKSKPMRQANTFKMCSSQIAREQRPQRIAYIQVTNLNDCGFLNML